MVSSAFCRIFLVLGLCQACGSPNTDINQKTELDDTQLAKAIADSIEVNTSVDSVSNDSEVSSMFNQPVEVKQGDFRTGNTLSYFLPLTIKNTTNRRIKGLVLERTGKGLSESIYIGKFPVNLLANKTVKMRLTLRDLDVSEEELHRSDGINSSRFMHIRVGQVIYSNGEIEKVVYLPDSY